MKLSNLQLSNNQQNKPNQFNISLYSPRTTYSNHLTQIYLLKINMIINIDKYILGNLKSQFDKRNKKMTLLQFIYFSKMYLKDWNKQLYGREVKILQCLMEIWKEIDLENKGIITWEEFNSKIIQSSLNIKGLSNNTGVQVPNFRQINLCINQGKYEQPIAKIVYLKDKDKMAFFRQESTQINFFSTQIKNSQTQDNPTLKPLILPQQELKVQTLMKIKLHNEDEAQGRTTKNTGSLHKHKLVKKDLKVSSYRNTVLDAIFIDDPKYNMLLVSCSDKFIRGYNVSNINPVIATQPENQDENMIHQFPVEIYNMVWDSLNEILYASGKNPKIYQWLIKTDSQRQISDTNGHEKMISTLFMMPKLQLLASGGYDGQLILWDTVGQVVKCKYEQHTRAISSITFHQQLILLFTSSYDHKICIWNPYITSLIHKIDNTLNVISIQIIPNTNFLLSIDCGGNAKVRQINRFTQITSFNIYRSQNKNKKQMANNKNSSLQKQKQLTICMCSKKDDNVQYYFGTDTIMGFEYVEIQKSSILGGCHLCMKYVNKDFLLLTPLKNHIVIWNMLIGKVNQIFYDVTQNDISSFQIIQDLNYMIIGDVNGNVILKRLNNGFLIKNLLQFKSSIVFIKYYQIYKGQQQKKNQKIYILFICTQDGDFCIMKCYPKSQFEIYKQFSLKNDFNISLGSNIVDIMYHHSKNLLIVTLSTNQIIVIEIQKKNISVKLELGDQSIKSMNIVTHQQNRYILLLTKNCHLIGYYLPPSLKKFKNSCFITYQGITKLQSAIFSPMHQKYYLSTQSNELYCIKLSKSLLQHPQKQIPHKQNHQWKTTINFKVKNMTIIQKQQLLLILDQNQQIHIISTQTGQTITTMKHSLNSNSQPSPILFFKQKQQHLYIPNQQKIIKLSEQQQHENKQKQVQVNKIINPNYFINFLTKNKNIKNFSKVSNSNWLLNLKIQYHYESKIKEIMEIQNKLQGYNSVLNKKSFSQIQIKMDKAIELHKKIENEKQEYENKLEDMRSNYQQNRDSKNSLYKKYKSIQRQSHNQLINFSKADYKQRSQKKFSYNSIHNDQRKIYKKQKSELNLRKQNDLIDLGKLKNSPLFRLGQALKSVNEKDQKANFFIQLAKKKQSVKFPKINIQKIKQTNN